MTSGEVKTEEVRMMEASRLVPVVRVTLDLTYFFFTYIYISNYVYF